MATLVKVVHEVKVKVMVKVEVEVEVTVVVAAVVVVKTMMVPPLPRKKLDHSESIPLIASTNPHHRLSQRILFFD
jgi:hypothetical protein